jgi:hypothetical protein
MVHLQEVMQNLTNELQDAMFLVSARIEEITSQCLLAIPVYAFPDVFVHSHSLELFERLIYWPKRRNSCSNWLRNSKPS